MGEVAVLQPQNCLRDRIPPRQTLICSQMKPPRNPNPTSSSRPPKASSSPNPNPNPNPNPARSGRRKRSPEKKKSNRSKNTDEIKPKVPVMGQVRILKRGEDLCEMRSLVGEKVDLVLSNRLEPNMSPINESEQERLGTEPMVITKLYAGSTVVTSPPPSSLPLPAFVLGTNDYATSDLRRLLRLQLT